MPLVQLLLGVVIALILMGLGERLKNRVIEVYEDKGLSWKKVLIYSNLSAIVAGLTSILIIYITKMPANLNPTVLPFAVTITTYITVQSIMTDTKTLLINRNILRVAYLSMYVVAVYNVIFIPEFRFNDVAIILFTVVLILIFFFSSIGSSDVRAIAVALPYSVSIGGYNGVKLLMLSLTLVSIYMIFDRGKLKKKMLKEYRVKYDDMAKEMSEKEFKKVSSKVIKEEFENNDEHALAVGPFMIVPFLIYFLVFPIFL